MKSISISKNLKISIKPNWTSWREAVERELNYLSKNQDYFGTPSSESIHAFRKSVKFVRALLDLAPRSIAKDAESLSKNLTKISKTLSRLRDRHVHSQILAEFKFALDRKEKIPLTNSEIYKLKKAQDRVGIIIRTIKSLPVPKEAPAEILFKIQKQIKKANMARPKIWNARKIKSIHKYRAALICENNQLLFLNSLTGKPSIKKLKRLDLHRQMLGQINDLSQSIDKIKSFSANSRHERYILKKMKDKRKHLFEKLAYQEI